MIISKKFYMTAKDVLTIFMTTNCVQKISPKGNSNENALNYGRSNCMKTTIIYLQLERISFNIEII